MVFIDEIDIYIASGNGGNGLHSFSKMKSNKSIYDGGNGGNGGNVFLYGNKNHFTLQKLTYKHKYNANDGENGKRNCKTGKNGKDLFIDVPLGTIVYDNERKTFLGEIINHKECLLVVSGGKGGIGNFVTKKYNTKIKYGSVCEIKFLHL